jgi:hypothetical protein
MQYIHYRIKELCVKLVNKNKFIILEVYEVPTGLPINPKLKLLCCSGVPICCIIYISIQFVNFKNIY